MFDKATTKEIGERMEELKKDKSFMSKIDKEVGKLKGKGLKTYISKEASTKSERERNK